MDPSQNLSIMKMMIFRAFPKRYFKMRQNASTQLLDHSSIGMYSRHGPPQTPPDPKPGFFQDFLSFSAGNLGQNGLADPPFFIFADKSLDCRS